MELEYGVRGRCGNNSETQAARFQQLVAYYAQQDYYEHTLRDALSSRFELQRFRSVPLSSILERHVQLPTTLPKYLPFFHLLCF